MTNTAAEKDPPFVEATGRRKTSTAVVRIHPGSGRILVNGRPLEEYFCGRPLLLSEVLSPLRTCGVESRYDAMVRAIGGGVVGQAGATRLGLARALLMMNPEFRKPLRNLGALTRDPRMKERKKYGQKRARKRFQYTKR